MKARKIVITGGGTGGHVFPALAIASELKKRNFSVLYVGSPLGLESKILPSKDIPFYSITTGAFKNQSPLKIFRSVWHLSRATSWAFRFLKAQKPLAIVGVGGYVSVPVCLSGFLLRIPVFLQEQNTSAGIANRVLGKLATKIFLGFEEAKENFPEAKCVVTGNPLREGLENASFDLQTAPGPSLLIMGGSQGAKSINEAMMGLIPQMAERFPEMSILHQTGEKDVDRVEKSYSGSRLSYRVVGFIEDMASAYAAASLVICRSGALTISELIKVQRPAILIPYPRRGQNDQTANAYWLAMHGVARVVEQGDGFSEQLWSTLLQCLQPDVLRSMRESYSKLRTGPALVTIGDQIEAALGDV